MNGKKRKNKTALLLDVMVWNADKEPSGFWTDDYEGCGNLKKFSEFEAGLKYKYRMLLHLLYPGILTVICQNAAGVLMRFKVSKYNAITHEIVIIFLCNIFYEKLLHKKYKCDIL